MRFMRFNIGLVICAVVGTHLYAASSFLKGLKTVKKEKAITLSLTSHMENLFSIFLLKEEYGCLGSIQEFLGIFENALPSAPKKSTIPFLSKNRPLPTYSSAFPAALFTLSQSFLS